MGKALIYEQILLTNSSRKCMEISLENLHLDIGALELWAWELNSKMEHRTFSPFSNKTLVPKELKPKS